MKRCFLILVALLLVVLPLKIDAADIEFSTAVGVFMQDGHKGELNYSAGGDLNWYTIEQDRHSLSIEGSFTWSDFKKDKYIARAYPVYYERPLASIGSFPLNIGAGIGVYHEINSGGDDLDGEAGMVTIGLNKIGLSLDFIGEVLKYDGPDLYSVSFGATFMFF